VERARPGASIVNSMKARLLVRWLNKAEPLPMGISSAQLVWGIVDQGARFAAGRLASYLRRYREATIIEVICHPGLPELSDPVIPSSYGRLRVPHNWQIEAQTILSAYWTSTINECGFSLTHFGEIEP